MNLIIIGNGFDLYHGIPSKYSEFREYVFNKRPELIEKFEFVLGWKYEEIDWNQLEKLLGEVPDDWINYLKDSYSSSIVSYASDDWSDSFHHEYSEAMLEEMYFGELLKEYFFRWACKLNGYLIKTKTEMGLNKSDAYLTFNYTDTLESLYGIESNSCHIHGQASHLHNNSLVVGHGNHVITERYYKKWKQAEQEQNDPRFSEGEQTTYNYFINSLKDTDEVIKLNEKFFRYIKSNADEIDHVYILGHSLNEVDQPYFKEISKSLQNKKWICSYYSENEIERLANSLEDFQIDNYEFKKMQEIEIINN